MGAKAKAAKEGIETFKRILKKFDSVEKVDALRKAGSPEYERYLKALDGVYGPREQRAAEMGFGKYTWYHGTTVPIDEFTHEARGLSTQAESAKKGFFFAKDPSTASDYANLAQNSGLIREGDKVTTRYLSENAPLLDDIELAYKEAKMNRKFAVEDFHRQLERNKNTQELIEIIKKDGDPHQRLPLMQKKFNSDLEHTTRLQNNIKAYEAEMLKLEDTLNSGGQNVIPVRLRGDANSIHVKNYKGAPYRDTTYADEMVKAQESGKNAVLFKNTYDPADPNNRVKQDIAAVFEPEQIRSTQAAFDPRFKKSGNIMAGVAAAPAFDFNKDVSNPKNFVKAAADKYVSGVNTFSRRLAELMNPKMPYQSDDDRQKTIDAATMIGEIGFDPANFIAGPAGTVLDLAGFAGQAKKPNQQEKR